MKNISKIILLLFITAQAGVFSSCKDEEDQVILQGSGEYKITVLNQNVPVANTKVVLYDLTRDNTLNVLNTNDKGEIDFGKLIEGTYSINMEVKSPQYVNLTEEFQVVSGQRKESTIKVEDYTGSLTIYAVDYNNYDKIITEDFGLGVVAIPHSKEYMGAYSTKEKYALKTSVQYFGTSGKVTFENLPTATYDLYTIQGDSIAQIINSYYTIDKDDKSTYRHQLNFDEERVLNKGTWTVVTAKYSNGNALTNFPIKTIKFTRGNSVNNSSFTMTLNNGVIVNGQMYLSPSSYNNDLFKYYDLSSYSASQNFDVEFYENGFRINENGLLVLKLNSMYIENENGSTYYSAFNSFEVILQ